MFRPRRINSTDARKHFTKIVNSVQFSSRCYVIENYHNPVVRIINEHYIKVLEEVLGKKTVNHIMQITGNDRLLEAEKMEQIKKVFQRRLSGTPRPERRQPKPQPQKPRTQGKPSPPPPKPQKQPQKQNYPPPKPKPKHPVSPPDSLRNSKRAGSAKPQASNNRVLLLLQDGKNYA